MTINDLYRYMAKIHGFTVWDDCGLMYHPIEGLLFRLKAVPYTKTYGDGKVTWQHISALHGPEKPHNVIFEMMTGKKPPFELLPPDGDWSNIKWNNINPPMVKHRTRS